jgi:superfamily II DNA or RNA helicase
VGYYVGGMKEPELKKSETCQVIIATYAMAAEALDIKTLTTLILATPKTDVVQAVGRILRVKHERPLVVDIIDSHDVFLSQWQKRRKYYASNNYKIMHTKSNLYASNKWTTLESVAKKTKTKNKEEVQATNLLGKGVAAAARFINTIHIDNGGEFDNDVSEDAYADNHPKFGQLSGRCFILQNN